MYKAFPSHLLALLRCPVDGAELAAPVPPGSSAGLADGEVRCGKCSTSYGVCDGVLSLMVKGPVHRESAREMEIRNARAEAVLRWERPEWQSPFADATELGPMMAELDPRPHVVVAELGCGTGRLTLPLAQRGATVIAVDFSLQALTLLRQKLGPNGNVALVHADATALGLAPRSFDRVASTLHSNLPTREHRMACLRIAADALADHGRFVFGMHFRGVRDLLAGVPAAGHYPETGIFRYRMRPAEARREAAPFFGRVRVRPIQVRVPGLRVVWAARLASHVPVLRSFAELLLAVGDQPRRPPAIDAISRSS